MAMSREHVRHGEFLGAEAKDRLDRWFELRGEEFIEKYYTVSRDELHAWLESEAKIRAVDRRLLGAVLATVQKLGPKLHEYHSMKEAFENLEAQEGKTP
jgi:hypothetical protein